MALMDVHADGQEVRHERICGALPDLLEILDRTEIIALRDGHELLAQLASELPEPGRTLRAQRGEGAHELDAQVARDGVEQQRIVLEQGVHALPAHLDDRDHVASEPHRNADEGCERRKEPRLDREGLLRVLAHDRALGERPRAQHLSVGRTHPEAQCMALAGGERLDGTAEIHELGDDGAGEGIRRTAEMEAVGSREVDERAVGSERLGDAVEHAVEEHGDVLGIERVEYDGESAREALVGTRETDDPLFELAVVFLGIGIPGHGPPSASPLS